MSGCRPNSNACSPFPSSSTFCRCFGFFFAVDQLRFAGIVAGDGDLPDRRLIVVAELHSLAANAHERRGVEQIIDCGCVHRIVEVVVDDLIFAGD